MTIIDLGPVNPDEGEPVTVAELKGWARIDRDDEDVLIAALGRAARETIEQMTGLVMSRRTFRLALDPVPEGGWIELPRRPLARISAIAAFDANGVPQDFDRGEAVIERALGIEAIRVSPAVRQAAANGIEVEFEAGFAPGDVPEPLKLALKTIASASYEVRGAVDITQQPAILPNAARALIAPYQRRRL